MPASVVSDSGYSAFRTSEKYFKSRAPAVPPTGSLARRFRKRADPSASYPLLKGQGVIDLSRPDNLEEDEVRLAGWKVDEDATGGRPIKKIKVRRRIKESSQNVVEEVGGYIVGDGLILIPGYIPPAAQLTSLQSALSEYTLPPNPLNLSTHYVLPHSAETSLFSLYAQEPDELIETVASKGYDHGSPSLSSNSNPEGKQGSEWKADQPSAKLKSKSAGALFGSELRWANLGWVYNWTNKAYDFGPSHNYQSSSSTSEQNGGRRQPIPFPAPLAQTCAGIVQGIPWREVFDAEHPFSGEERIKPDGYETWDEDYLPDTGIVNFYHTKDTLMGHVDRAEVDPYRPLVSISLGHAALFLVGGTTTEEPPVPIILRSGDVLVMAGRGRKCYHGVPRIMENTLPRHFLPEDGDETDTKTMKACKRFISDHRININARQVFPKGER